MSPKFSLCEPKYQGAKECLISLLCEFMVYSEWISKYILGGEFSINWRATLFLCGFVFGNHQRFDKLCGKALLKPWYLIVPKEVTLVSSFLCKTRQS